MVRLPAMEFSACGVAQHYLTLVNGRLELGFVAKPQPLRSGVGRQFANIQKRLVTTIARREARNSD
jgi:hypothetical protein